MLENDLEDLWRVKVKEAARISKAFGFPEQDIEFWMRQPAGVISLLLRVYAERFRL